MAHIFQNPIANLFQVEMNWNTIRTPSGCSDLKWECMCQCYLVCITSGSHIAFLGLFFILTAPHALGLFIPGKGGTPVKVKAVLQAR